jgi:hypothetical protein
MTPQEALRRARGEGAQLSVRGETLHLAAREPLSEATLASVREHREALLAILALEGAQPLVAQPPVPEQRYPFEVRWGRERGWLRLRDCFRGEWLEVLASECPTWWQARRSGQSGGLGATRVTEPLSVGELVILAGAERLLVSGRAAVLIVQIATHAAALNRIPVGRLVADFAHAKTKIDLTESFPALRTAP